MYYKTHSGVCCLIYVTKKNPNKYNPKKFIIYWEYLIKEFEKSLISSVLCFLNN